MAVILALDTSTEACSCALSIDGAIDEHHAVTPRQHARLILPMIGELLGRHSLDFSSLDAIAFGRGPGSFTGLRIAAGVTQGIAFAAGLPVVAVSTLAAVALDVHLATGATNILACLDARIDEIYWGQFHVVCGLPVLVGEEHLCRPELLGNRFITTEAPWAVGGNGLVYQARFPALVQPHLETCLPDLLPRAAHIATLATSLFAQQLCITADEVVPVYLRDKVTHQ